MRSLKNHNKELMNFKGKNKTKNCGGKSNDLRKARLAATISRMKRTQPSQNRE